MRKLSSFRVSLCLLFSILVTGLHASSPIPAPYQKGKVIFRMAPEYRTSSRVTGVDLPEFQVIFNQIKAGAVNKKFPKHELPSVQFDARGNKLVDLSLIYEVSFDPAMPVSKVIQSLLATGKVIYAEPVYTMELLYNPNDPDTASQYYLTLIKAFDAWDVNQGDTNFVVGVTDTGADLDHPDLAAGIKYNYADPINGADDDGDGFIDNFYGWDVGDNDNDPSVDVVHGSFVCGLAGAVTDNGTGIAGTGFKTRFLPIKISSNGILNAAYDGIVYAADHGCQIINCSWGGFGGGQFGQDVVDYATINKNALVVGASGNSNNEAPFFPASYNNVLSVTGTNNTDTKWVNSSYGAFVDMSAPGEGIYSTIFDNNYSFSSGTSFAAPIVAAAAAILRTQFAFYTPMQIAEQLRMTSDDIYTVPGNASYINKLGKGRLNLFRALTESPKSVRMISQTITDNNDNAFSGDDTLDITVFLRNYLAPLTSLNAVLTCNVPGITILNGNLPVGSMNTLTDYDNSGTPFRVVIPNGIAFNTKVTFTLSYADAGYSDWQIFDLVVNVDYINVLINDVGTSITSKGRIGYNEGSQVQGIGFTYNDGSSLWYEGGLVLGTDTSHVSDHLFGSPVSVMSDDFISMINVRKVIPTIESDFDLDSRFNDDGAGATQLDVEVNQKTYAWSTPADSKYIIVEYIISNKGSNQLTDFFAGIYGDWDIGAVIDNRGQYDSGLKMGYAFNTGSPTVYAGVKQLNSGPNNVYAFDNDGAGGTIGIYNGYTKAEKYQSLSTLRNASGQSGAGNDVSIMVASGPHTIPSGDSITVAFALLAGDDLTSLTNSAIAADIKYSTLNSIIPLQPVLTTSLSQNFPNPFSGETTINYSLATDEAVTIEIYNVLGELVATPVNNVKVPAGEYSFDFKTKGGEDGFYYCRMIAGSNNLTIRMISIQ
ncbi:MAG: S8 family serine peptidase [Bacteroidetes bacterium]|nr:S8 family serine peptidase [Bacteroidota bacterium]